MQGRLCDLPVVTVTKEVGHRFPVHLSKLWPNGTTNFSDEEYRYELIMSKLYAHLSLLYVDFEANPLAGCRWLLEVRSRCGDDPRLLRVVVSTLCIHTDVPGTDTLLL